MLLHVLGHVDPDHRVLAVEHELGQRARQLGLADAGGPDEQERADRPVGVLEAGARAPERIRHGLDRLVLADHPRVQALLHVHELLDLALHQARDRDPRPLGDDLRDVLGVDDILEISGPTHTVVACGVVLCFGGRRQLLLELGDRPVLELGRASEVGLALGALEVDLGLLEALLDLGHGTDRLLLALPLGVHPVRALALLGERALELLAPRHRAGIIVVAQRLELDLELHDVPVDLVDLDWLGVDLHPDPCCRPRRPGRSPCRGGSGPRYSAG